MNIRPFMSIMFVGEYWFIFFLFIFGAGLVIACALLSSDRRKWYFWSGLAAWLLAVILTFHFFSLDNLKTAQEIIRSAAEAPQIFRYEK